MVVLENAKEALTLNGARAKDGRKLGPEDLGVQRDISIVIDSQKKIEWVGPANKLPKTFSNSKKIDVSQYIITPEVVDSHTHLVFGGNRSFEYEMRLNGADYQEIAKAGGGILCTMDKTLNTPKEELLEKARHRISTIASYGIRTIEIKSGYALTLEKEQELTEIIQQLKSEFSPDIQIFNTMLAAHAVPKGKTSKQYLDEVVLPLVERNIGIIDAVDIFHEQGYFNDQDLLKLFDFCKANSIPTKLHADEFNDNKGAVFAAKYGSLSADHLLATTKDGVQALANSSTIATLLPGTAFFLAKPLANARAFLDAGCKVALASDYNPGSCHCDNLILIASMAAKNLGMNHCELWAAITLNAAAALGRTDQGSIEVGQKARFSFFETGSYTDIFYSWGKNFSVDVTF